jgi:hypothetical protein
VHHRIADEGTVRDAYRAAVAEDGAAERCSRAAVELAGGMPESSSGARVAIGGNTTPTTKAGIPAVAPCGSTASAAEATMATVAGVVGCASGSASAPTIGSIPPVPGEADARGAFFFLATPASATRTVAVITIFSDEGAVAASSAALKSTALRPAVRDRAAPATAGTADGTAGSTVAAGASAPAPAAPMKTALTRPLVSRRTAISAQAAGSASAPFPSVGAAVSADRSIGFEGAANHRKRRFLDVHSSTCAESAATSCGTVAAFGHESFHLQIP